MAIDTSAKRIAMLNFGSSMLDLLPEPDGSIDEDDRWTLLDLYCAAASVGATDVIFTSEAFLTGGLAGETFRS